MLISCATPPEKEINVNPMPTIKSTLSKKMVSFQYCYEKSLLKATRKELKMNPSPWDGRVVLKWEINRRGETLKVKVAKTEISDKRLSKCIIKVLQKIKFSPHEEPQNLKINHPFEFKSNFNKK